ncbi:sulfite exporter TauE/SafE family protein [Pokkaliibacter sp. CJK22405]|uniref:sulfite exporter TauE/SafE family protein n=1 Tax=Pokkaliibacter sp. CJK22405 TaxID=3384615 RepID=UPI0039851640
MMLYGVLAVIGLGAGITTVLFGFGGGFLMVPVMYQGLILAYGEDSAIGQAAMHCAVATSTSLMIFSSLMATRKHHKAGTLKWAIIRPLLGFIALGALMGAAVATWVSSAPLRWLFISYLGITILDCLFRPGFTAPSSGEVHPLGKVTTAIGGTLIGGVAACLGVGGSVMTVPMLRRMGASMTQATAMASPLTFPVSIAGTLGFVLFSWQEGQALGGLHLGYIDVLALFAMMAGSWCGIRLASRWIGKLPDRLHSRIYIALLIIFWLAMLL